MMRNLWNRVKLHSTAVCSVIAIGLITVILWMASLHPTAIPSLSSDIDNWGLSFQEEGQPPVGNASGAYLKEFDAYYQFPEDDKEIYLTFDAGYENGNMPRILEALEKHRVKATFFLVGHFMESEPELLKKMTEAGHTIGNHSFSHPDMAAIQTEAAFREELETNEALYREITGKEMSRLYRPPQGKYSQSNLAMAQDLGYQTVFWSLAYVDWQQDHQPSPEEAYSKLLPRVHPGAIVLLHSTSETNGEILDELLTKWEGMGYRFGDLERKLTNP